MTEHPIDELLAAAAPIGDGDVAAFQLDGLDLELREATMSTKTPTSIDAAAIPPGSPARKPTYWRIRVAAAVAAVVATGLIVSPFDRGGERAWAAEVLAVAEASPRLLVDLPGWSVTRAHTFTVEEGEMTFSNGEQTLDLHWRPASQHEGFLADRAASSEPAQPTTVDGKPATQYQYLGTTDFTTLWLDSDHSFEARGLFANRTAYQAVIDALAPTDVDTWLLAMPDSVVKPDSRLAVMEAMVADMPEPAELDLATVAAGTDVSDRYQLGAQVAGAVACRWIEQWLDARTGGDTAAESEALEAMQSSRNWAVLLEMQDSGAYPQVLWMHIDAMEAGGNDPNGLSISGYRDALGCS